METTDIVVIGGGISGTSIAYELSRHASVTLLEMESALAFHTSGRSLATFVESYGPTPVRALTRASRPFFEDPPTKVDSALFTDLGLLMVAREGQAREMRDFHASITDSAPMSLIVSPDEVREINPLIAEGHAELGMFDPATTEIDVHELQQGYVRGLKANAGVVRKSAKVVDIRRADGSWTLTTADGTSVRASTVVNAAGSWVDEIATLAGLDPIGIRPLRRSAFMVGAPDGITARSIPLTGNLDHSWTIMPQGEMFACSPSEETLTAPSDAKPDQLEIARSIDDLNEATILRIRHISSPWAGLRNFVADGLPVAGRDPSEDSFFWYAGQGGYGMQLAPALSQLAAADILSTSIDPGLLPFESAYRELAPSRLSTPST